jgi:hypothetical protein
LFLCRLSVRTFAAASSGSVTGNVSLLLIMNPPDKSLEVFDYDNSELHSSIGYGAMCHQLSHLGDVTVRLQFSQGC